MLVRLIHRCKLLSLVDTGNVKDISFFQILIIVNCIGPDIAFAGIDKCIHALCAKLRDKRKFLFSGNNPIHDRIYIMRKKIIQNIIHTPIKVICTKHFLCDIIDDKSTVINNQRYLGVKPLRYLFCSDQRTCRCIGKEHSFAHKSIYRIVRILRHLLVTSK